MYIGDCVMEDTKEKKKMFSDRSRGASEIQVGIWMIGLGLLFYFGIIWPGILILIGISSVVDGIIKMK